MDEAVAPLQRRAVLVSELNDLIAQRTALDRTQPGSVIALARLSAQISAKARALREVNTALASAVVVLDALSKRADIDRVLLDMGYEPDPEYIERTYGPGWRRKPPEAAQPPVQPVLDSVPPALDPLLALAAVTDRMADLVEVQARAVTAASSRASPAIEVNLPAPVVHVAAPVVQNDISVQPAAVDVSVTATMPARQTVTDVQRDPRSGDITRTIQTERDAPEVQSQENT
jgi:hypothetical protein